MKAITTDEKTTDAKTSVKVIVLREMEKTGEVDVDMGVNPESSADIYIDKSESKDKWHTVAQAQPDDDGSCVFDGIEIGGSYRIRWEYNGISFCTMLDKIGVTDAANTVTLKIPCNVSCADATLTKNSTGSASDKPKAEEETLKKTDTADKYCAADKCTDDAADKKDAATVKYDTAGKKA